MSKITVRVSVRNIDEPERRIDFGALVDTGASMLLLPSEWKRQMGGFRWSRAVDCLLADQSQCQGELCGPVEMTIEGFDTISTDVLFVNMKGNAQPLLGHVPLEQSFATIDLQRQRLVKSATVDLM